MEEPTNEVETFDDGSERFGEFKIRRPGGQLWDRENRRTRYQHRNMGCKLTLNYETEEEQPQDREDSANSIYCTPNDHPLITKRIIRHYEATGCDIVGHSRAERSEKITVSKHVNIHQSNRLNYTRKLGRSSEKVQRKCSTGNKILDTNSFEGLNAEDTVLIASSSKEIERLPIERLCRYTELAEQLMKNTRVVFSNESMNRRQSEGMSQKQKSLLKTVTIDFRRQTKVDGINDRRSTNKGCILEGCNRKN
jgi:hypothetical protein